MIRLLRLAALFVGLAAPGAGNASAQWVEAPGRGWAALTVYHQDTREVYGLDGDTRPFFAEGRAVTTSGFLTVAAGLLPSVDVWAQLSFHRLRFDDIAGDRTSTGAGDSRFWLRIAPLRPFGVELPVAVRGGIKVPFGDFDVDAEVIPLGDGQRDWEVMLELGRSLHPRPIYLMGWVGYRWRELNVQSARDFGDEVFYYVAVGGDLGRLGYKLAIDGWTGDEGVVEGVRVPTARRDLVQLAPSALLDLGPGSVELGARFTLSGRNLPSGTAFFLGYFTPWSLR